MTKTNDAPAQASVEAVNRIAEFLKERDESVLPEEIDNAERKASAEEILRLAALSPPSTVGAEDVAVGRPREDYFNVKAERDGFPSMVHWIREYRTRTGANLKVAKDAYDLDQAMPATRPAPAADGGGVKAILAMLDAESGDTLKTLWGVAAKSFASRIRASLASDASPRGEADMRRICEALGFDPGNHHNALKCPYCNPKGLQFAHPAPATVESEGITTHQVWLDRVADRALQLGRRPTRAEILMCASDWAALAPATEGRKG